MFHVVDPETKDHVFTEEDPREDGFVELVDCDITLDEFDGVVGEGHEYPRPHLGRSNEDHRLFRVFRSLADCTRAGFVPLSFGFGVPYERWSAFKSKTTGI
jgi:hypothetical protein